MLAPKKIPPAAIILLVAMAMPPAARSGTPATVALSFTAYSPDPEGVSIGVVGQGRVQIAEVWLSLKDLRFRSMAACEKPGLPQVKAPVTAELVGGRTRGLPASLSMEPDRYCALDAVSRRATGREEGVPMDLRGQTILVRGRRSDGVHFVLRSRRAEKILLKAVSPEGFPLDPGATRLFFAANLARWMEGIDLFTAELARDGTGPILRIDEKSNPALLAAFEANLAAGLFLYRDLDGDGALSVSERSPGQVLAAGSR